MSGAPLDPTVTVDRRLRVAVRAPLQIRRNIVADEHNSSAPFIRHSDVLKEGSSEQRGIWLAARVKVNGGESPVEGHIQGRDVNLSEVYIRLELTTYSGNCIVINDRQLQPFGENRVDTTFGCARVH